MTSKRQSRIRNCVRGGGLGLLALASSLAIGTAAEAANWFVRASGGSDTNDGDLWEVAFATVQHALDMASTDDIIYVAAGTYKPSEPIDTNVPQTKTFHVHAGKLVSIQGGYPPSGGDPHSPDAYPTVFSGDLDGDDPSDYSDNSYHVVLVEDCTTRLVLDGVTVEHGRASGSGSGGQPTPSTGYGGGVMITRSGGSYPCDPVIQNCRIRDSYGTAGGGIAVHSYEPTAEPPYPKPSIRNTAFFDNSTGKSGGGLLVDGTSVEVLDSLFVENAASGSTFGGGMAIWVPGEPGVALVHCTVAYNTCGSTSGAGVDLDNAEGVPTTIDSCIFVLNAANGEADNFEHQLRIPYYPGDVTMDYSDVTDYVNSGLDLGTGNISDADPLFVDNGPSGNHSAGNFALQSDSPCIDTGQPTSGNLPVDTYDADSDSNSTEPLPDLARRGRIYDGDYDSTARADMGAYEYLCLGDIDGDADVDATDLAILLGAWGTCSGECTSDLNRDRDVGGADYSILLGAWGSCGSGGSAAMEGGSAPTAMDLVAWFGFDTIGEFSAYVEELPDGLREALILGAIEMMSGGGA